MDPTIVQGLALWAECFLALWRMDGGVLVWSFLEKFWVCFSILYIILIQWLYSCMKGCVGSILCLDNLL